MRRYIEPPAHFNSKPARLALLENSTVADKSDFKNRTLKNNERFLIRAIRNEGRDLWFSANQDVIDYAEQQVFWKIWKDWELRVWDLG